MIPKKPPPGDFRKILGRLSHRHSTRQVFDAFLCFAACALAAQTREAEYVEEAKRWEKPDLELFAEAFAALVSEMESRPFEDLIGGYYLEFALSQKGQQWNGEFHTPKPICDLMARMTLGDLESLPAEGPITVCEPACGAGAMILSLAEVCPPEVRRRLRVTAVDINRTACNMAFINTTLWGIPTRVIHGNSLSLECWAAWSNIHYLAPWLPLTLRIQTPEALEQGQPPQPAEMERIKASLVQQELVF
ncbi:MAG: type I restriction modification system-like protein [Limisphaerales bacterium]|nr:MAG: type I restriction modification system-like protein [Limisphaerales bacterium]KAG0510342.1 MAG: type I restriction modification system-like protein [Limisphaerales bacterium]TXT51529.1 MAG: type I restriction modification system-like protein [Limisphaerales bacterium]